VAVLRCPGFEEAGEKESQVDEDHYKLAQLVDELRFPAGFYRMHVAHRAPPLLVNELGNGEAERD
jgi:hypothetical protein